MQVNRCVQKIKLDDLEDRLRGNLQTVLRSVVIYQRMQLLSMSPFE